MFDVSHMGQIKTAGPEAEAFLQRLLSQRRRQARPRRRPVLLPLRRRRRDPRRPLQLPARGRLLLDGLERRQPRIGPRPLPRDRRRLRRRGRGPGAGARDARRPGPRGAGGGGRRSPTASCRLACTRRCSRSPARGRSSAGPATPGEDGVEIILANDGAAELWRGLLDAGVVALRARRPRHPPARGLLPPARLRHGSRPQPDRGGPRLVLQGGDGLRRLGGGRRGARAGHRREARRLRRSRAGGSLARATRYFWTASPRATVTSGTFSPSLEIGIGMGYVSVRAPPSPGPGSRSTCAESVREAEIRSKPLYSKD